MTLAVVSLGLPTFLAAPPASSLSIHVRRPLPFSDSVLGPFSLPHLPSFKHTYSQLPADISTQMPLKPFQLSQSQMEATSCCHQRRAGSQLLCVWFSSHHWGLTDPQFLYILGSGMAESHGSSTYKFLRNFHTFSLVSVLT